MIDKKSISESKKSSSPLRRYPLHCATPSSGPLSPEEIRVLRASGAAGLNYPSPTANSLNITTVAAEYSQMAVTALSRGEVAKLLGISISQVQRRIDDRLLYSIDNASRDLVCPRFQFYGNATLPYLESVLAAIHAQAHPVAVQRFFLTTTADLESPVSQQPHSPREWLIQGYLPELVIMLAKDL